MAAPAKEEKKGEHDSKSTEMSPNNPFNFGSNRADLAPALIGSANQKAAPRDVKTEVHAKSEAKEHDSKSAECSADNPLVRPVRYAPKHVEFDDEMAVAAERAAKLGLTQQVVIIAASMVS